MERWLGRVAVVTGASAGIGAACAQYLANNGMIVVGLARRKERIETLRETLKPEASQRLHAIQCDVRKEQDIIDAFKQIESEFGSVAVLVNNAGILRFSDLVSEDNTSDLRDTIDTNVLGVAYCTREAFRAMRAHGGDGHVFLINSIAGHNVASIPGLSWNMYPSSKYAVTAMTEVYRQEFLKYNTKIKVTSISPGGVLTDILPMHLLPEDKTNLPLLKPEDVADALLYCLQTPPHVQIHELTIKPMGE
ncbi:farnesol dehydrogenase [Zeugodacus cucurbitae]|uniref:Dehydrogenase/reductase SDR family member 11 n=1 Tax=Zeugodacus cucurbitae TaxID=28588 RepID=A0A0A1WSH5_ZEUCU|nr:farnesol dehydrogenase [Zeugodacus cucurbitae]